MVSLDLQLDRLKAGLGVSTSGSLVQGYVTLHIPWCGRMLLWQLMPAPANLTAPDIVFDTDTYQPLCQGTDIAKQLSQMMLAWHPTDASQLVTFISLLLSGFLQHQHQCMLGHPSLQLQFELNTLPLQSGMQLLLIPRRGSSDVDKASFSIPLQGIDCSRLVSISTPAESATGSLHGTLQSGLEEDASVSHAVGMPASAEEPVQFTSAFRLLVTFHLTAAPTDPQLQLQAPASISALRPPLSPIALPPWSSHMCLAAYLPLVVERLQQQIDAQATQLLARQQLFEQLAILLGHPLEVNPGTSISNGVATGSSSSPSGSSSNPSPSNAAVALFSLQYEGQPLLLTVEISSRFPTEQPALFLQHTSLRTTTLPAPSPAAAASSAQTGGTAASAGAGANVSLSSASPPGSIVSLPPSTPAAAPAMHSPLAAAASTGSLVSYSNPPVSTSGATVATASATAAARGSGNGSGMLVSYHPPAPPRGYREYPWSPRWTAAEMAARIFNFLREEIPAYLGWPKLGQ